MFLFCCKLLIREAYLNKCLLLFLEQHLGFPKRMWIYHYYFGIFSLAVNSLNMGCLLSAWATTLAPRAASSVSKKNVNWSLVSWWFCLGKNYLDLGSLLSSSAKTWIPSCFWSSIQGFQKECEFITIVLMFLSWCNFFWSEVLVFIKSKIKM